MKKLACFILAGAVLFSVGYSSQSRGMTGTNVKLEEVKRDLASRGMTGSSVKLEDLKYKVASRGMTGS
ncbi:hypothetical protein [Bacillus zhangzhouensis]|uniref:Uncharacterized protein n=1 Tax=Bacillus zhangzhouensis TaxID=1178540 RepID=A0A081LDD6_9BACI|nr:hypothetical protein [Bacillus zhangzhouensis]KEP27262.1 hypothetical protein BA70_13075 [Bacillus zhangzhouensis]